MKQGIWAAVLGFGLTAASACADIADFAGTWVNPTKGDEGFVSGLIAGRGPSDEIARIVATPAGVNAVRLQLFGRCTPECDWGSAIAHNLSAAPDTASVSAITASFNTGFATKRVTLRKGPGRSLIFEVVTDFSDRSGRYDYVATGSLRFAPPAVVPPAVAAPASPTVPGLPAAPAPAAPFAAAADFSEDCTRINPEDIHMAPHERIWIVADYNHTILKFGADKRAAALAERVMNFYRFDEHCFVNKPKPKMTYWRIGGQFPREPMPGQDCVDLHPAAIIQRGGKLIDGDRVVLDYEDDAAGAAKALSVIKTYHLARQCFVGRPSQAMVYWLTK